MTQICRDDVALCEDRGLSMSAPECAQHCVFSGHDRVLQTPECLPLGSSSEPKREVRRSGRRGRSLVISNDERVTDAVCAVAERLSVLVRVRSHVEALAVLPQNANWAGAILDLDERDIDPLRVAKQIRDADALVPILALSSTCSRELINGLQVLRIEPVLKPIDPASVRSFLHRALVSGWLPDARIAAWVDAQAKLLRLTDGDVQLVAYAIGRESRERVLQRLGITSNTLKTKVRRVLRKFRARTMDSLAARAYGEALFFEDEPRV